VTNFKEERPKSGSIRKKRNGISLGKSENAPKQGKEKIRIKGEREKSIATLKSNYLRTGLSGEYRRNAKGR